MDLSRILEMASVTMFQAAQEVGKYIHANRFYFVRYDKAGLDGRPDVVTSIDLASQQIYINRLSNFGFGMVAEEGTLSLPCGIPGHDIYWTIDPVDGTEAFVRQQSHGVSTMIALVCDGVIVAACICDSNTGEAYYFNKADKPKRYAGREGIFPLLPIPKQLAPGIVLFGLRPTAYSPRIQQLLAAPAQGGLFRDIEVDKGSIGTRMARLWKGEVSAMVMKPRLAAPWDDVPVLGFCQQLRFVYMRLGPDGRFETFTPAVTKEIIKIDHDILVIHESTVPELRAWEAAH